MILSSGKRIMTSWANLKQVPSKKKEAPIQFYFEPVSNDYPSSLLAYLYSYIYCQRNAEPFYIVDSGSMVSPFFKSNSVVHSLKTTPSTGTNLCLDLFETEGILSKLSLLVMRRIITPIFEYNSQTNSRIDVQIANYGLNRQTFDAGIVLDVSGCVPAVVSGLQRLQKNTNKKTMNIFVMTDNLDLLKEFAMKGDPSWKYASLYRMLESSDPDARKLKTLAELKVVRGIDLLVLRFSSPLGKLISLVHPSISVDTQIVSIDGSRWKALS